MCLPLPRPTTNAMFLLSGVGGVCMQETGLPEGYGQNKRGISLVQPTQTGGFHWYRQHKLGDFTGIYSTNWGISLVQATQTGGFHWYI